MKTKTDTKEETPRRRKAGSHRAVACALVLGLLLGSAGDSLASGIPVVDIAHIIETVLAAFEQYEHLAELYSQTVKLKEQYETMKENLEKVEDLKNKFRDPENFVGAATANFSWILANGLGTPETTGLGWAQEDFLERAATLFPGVVPFAPGETPYGGYEDYPELRLRQLEVLRNNHMAMLDILFREDALRGEALRAARKIRDEVANGKAGAERLAELDLAMQSIAVEETVIDRHLQQLRANNEVVRELMEISSAAQTQAMTVGMLGSVEMPRMGSHPVKIFPSGRY